MDGQWCHDCQDRQDCHICIGVLRVSEEEKKTVHVCFEFLESIRIVRNIRTARMCVRSGRAVITVMIVMT